VAAGMQFDKAGLEMIPETRVSLTGDNAKNALELVEKLEDQDDVQAVYYNFDVEG
jgi:transcriptional/translational regulatory protein YebC/TACO1